ncbi:hypothetical protein RHMOL_Rhmol05G0166900 [Rhododendron molle]|uniref:Uncharacterized protein n=1 Tax=Rhododendron molle TaxID=49168 RepID=A0ACC0NR23_RHOML|nr:hypothetical protein RHMOL_Rhmol05G0166900 [Rhododendron molle]
MGNESLEAFRGPLHSLSILIDICCVVHTLSLSLSETLVTVKSSFQTKEKGEMADEATATCIDILLAIILPPLGVFLKFGCKVEFWICLLLTLFGYLPGIIYAVYAITK